MCRRHVFREGREPDLVSYSAVRRYSFVFVKYLDRAFGDAEVDFFAHKRIGNTVIALFVLDVIIDADPGFLPNRKFIGLFRQGYESRPVEGFEVFPPGFPQMFHFPVIDFFEESADHLVQLMQAEELPVPQPGQNPALNHLNANFSLGFILGFAFLPAIKLGGGSGTGFAVGSVLQFYIPLVLIYTFLNYIAFPVVPVISQNVAFDPISLILTVVFNTMLTLTILEFAGGR